MHHGIHQFVHTQVVLRGYRVNLIDSQTVEIGKHCLVTFSVNFVGDIKNLFPLPSQLPGDFYIRRRKTILSIHHKNDNVGLFNGQIALLAHLDKNFFFGGRFKSSGINQRKGPVVICTIHVITVACRPRLVDHDGLLFSGYSVEQGGFADIGTSDNRDDRFDFHTASNVSVNRIPQAFFPKRSILFSP